MGPERRQIIERLSAAGGVASALGGAAYLLARRHARDKPAPVAHPEILNTDRLDPAKRLLINKTALFIICGEYPDRKKIMVEFDITKHVAYYNIGYLKQYGLVERLLPAKESGIPPHYIPTPGLVNTLTDPIAYPYLEEALQERIAQKTVN